MPVVPRQVRQALTSWDHKTEYAMPKMSGNSGLGFSKTFELGGPHAFLADHKIDGRILMPVSVCSQFEQETSIPGKRLSV